MHVLRVNQNHKYIYIYIYSSVYTVFMAEISPNIPSYTVYIYGSGQPYICSSGKEQSGSVRS